MPSDLTRQTMTTAEILAELQRRLDPEPRVDDKAEKTIGRRCYLKPVPEVTCADGLHMSVQASEYHYCSPRDRFGPYTQVEIGFPSAPVARLLPFAEAPERPTATVYGYVPLEIVAETVADHGGFAS